MAKLNLYYHEQTNTWWVNQNISGFEFFKRTKTEAIGLGSIEYDTDNKENLKENNYEIESMYIPEHFKVLNGIKEDVVK